MPEAFASNARISKEVRRRVAAGRDVIAQVTRLTPESLNPILDRYLVLQ